MLKLDGKATAAAIRKELAVEVAALAAKTGRAPGLAVVLAGEDPASQIYVRNKVKACAEVGIKSFAHYPDADITTEEMLALVAELNADERVDGILVQLPLPKGVDERKVLEAIDPAKDADGFHPVNVGRMTLGLPSLVPCTPQGCLELLRRHGITTAGKNCVVVGRSNIVGKPLAILLTLPGEMGNATVTVCHSRTRDLAAECRRAEILFVAIGRAKMITADMVAEGAVVVDVGMNRTDEGLCGDVDYAGVAPKASAITPVPGGVGPMTIAMLLVNTVTAYKRRMGLAE